MKSIYFFIQHYPKWRTGGLKYHTIVYDYALVKGMNVQVFGNSKIEDRYYKLKLIRIFYGLLNTFRIPNKSIILMTNASFLDYIIPIILNKVFNRHKYFLIIHHLVQTEKPHSKSRRFLESRFVKLADGHMVISHTTKKQLIELGLIKDDAPIVPPGLDVSKDLSAEKKVFPHKHKILFVGTVERRKGLLDAMKALEYLKDYNFEFFVIGAIKEKKYYDIIILELKNSNNFERVTFLGKVDNDLLAKNYLNSSVFIFPSYWEGYGAVLAEAMAYGLPVVASNIPSTAEIIENGKEGLLFDLADYKQIAEQLKYLFDNPLRMTEMSINAKQKSKSFPSWNETSKKIMDILNNYMTNNMQ